MENYPTRNLQVNCSYKGMTSRFGLEGDMAVAGRRFQLFLMLVDDKYQEETHSKAKQ